MMYQGHVTYDRPTTSRTASGGSTIDSEEPLYDGKCREVRGPFQFRNNDGEIRTAQAKHYFAGAVPEVESGDTFTFIRDGSTELTGTVRMRTSSHVLVDYG